MNHGLESFEMFHIVSAALLLITALAAWSLGITSLFCVSRRKDEARICFPWLKAAFIIYSTGVSLRIASIVCMVISSRTGIRTSYGGDYPSTTMLVYLQTGMGFGATLLLVAAELLIIVTLVLFDYGLRIVRLGEKAKRNVVANRFAYAIFIILAVLQTVIFGVSLSSVQIESYRDGFDLNFYASKLWVKRGQLELACSIILLMIATGILIRSATVKHQSRKMPQVRRMTRFYVVCACMLVLRAAYDLLSSLYRKLDSRLSFTSDLDAAIELIEVLMSAWPVFIIMTILFAEGMKKRNNLRSVDDDRLMMQEEESTIGVAPLSGPSAPQSTIISASSPTEPVSTVPTIDTTSPMTEIRADPFPWANPIDDAPPEYTSERPITHRRPVAPNTATPPVLETTQSTTSSHMDISPHIEPPAHDEAMGLYHQADGLPPSSETLPYSAKK